MQKNMETLEEIMKPAARRMYLEKQYPIIKIVHDNSDVHTSRLAQAWFDPTLQQIELSPKFPDLNPIENVQANMQLKWRTEENKTKEQLRNHVYQVQNELTGQNFTKNLINSMKRMELIIENNGYWIPYQ